MMYYYADWKLLWLVDGRFIEFVVLMILFGKEGLRNRSLMMTIRLVIEVNCQ